MGLEGSVAPLGPPDALSQRGPALHWASAKRPRARPAPPLLLLEGPAGGEASWGWPSLGGLAPRPLRRCYLAAAPAPRLRVICGPLSQWEGVAPACSLFLGGSRRLPGTAAGTSNSTDLRGATQCGSCVLSAWNRARRRCSTGRSSVSPPPHGRTPQPAPQRAPFHPISDPTRGRRMGALR